MANNIPTQQVPSVEAQPAKAQGWNLDTRGAFGAGTADGLRDLRRGVADLSAGFKRAKAEADVSAVQNAETQLDRHINQRVYTGGVAYLSKKGEEAIVDFEDADQSLDREKQRLSESLANDEQRAAFERRAGAILSGTRRQMGGHLSKQVEFTKDVRDQAQIQETLRLAASPAYADEAEAKRIVGMQQDYDRATAARKGLPRPAVESLMRSTEAAVHETRLKTAMAADDYGEASAILERHWELLTPEKRSLYRRSIDDALEGFARASRPPKEEDVRKANTDRFRGELQTFLEEYEARVADGTQKQRLYQDPKVRANMIRRFLPGDVPMDAGAREQMRELILRETTPPKAELKGTKVKKGEGPESFETYERLNSLTAKGNAAGIEEFKSGTFYLTDEDREAGRPTSLIDLRSKGLISDAHFFQFSNLRRQLAEEAEPKDLAIRATHDRLFDGVIANPTNGYRLNPKTKNPAEQAKIGALRSAVHVELQKEAKRLGREPDESDILKITRSTISDVVIKDPGFLYDSMEQPALKAGLDGPAAAAVGRTTRSLPADKRVKATEDLAKRYQAFSPAVEAAFSSPAYARERLTPERVLEVEEVVRTNRGSIDQALGARLTNDEAENDRLRALLALDYIRKTQRR